MITSFSKGTPQKAYREEAITIRVAGDENHPPYEYTDDIGNYKGFNVDIMNALSIELGIDIEFIPMKWRDAIEALEKREVDVIQGMSKTEERQKNFLFATPTVINSQSIFVMKETSIISSLEDLVGLRVAFQYSDVNHENIMDTSGIIMLPKKNQEEAIDALLNGDADAYIGNRLTGLFYLQKYRKSFLVKMVGDQMNTVEYGPVTYNGNEELINLFNEGIELLKKSGTYDKIYAKWFGQEIIDGKNILKTYLEEIILSLIIIIIVFCLFIIWNKKLKKEVFKRTMELETANEELLLHQERINYLAYYDSVTMLPNRLFLVETLNKYIENATIENSRFAVLHLDLDRFKHISDTLGHNTGDKVLELVGKRIKKLIKKEDFFARIGGDEFIILKGNINNDSETIDMANTIIEEFNSPFEIAEYQLFLTTSIGISIYPYGGENSNDLIKNSDISMYVAKGNGGNSYYVYNKALSEKQMENLILINELRQAIGNSELAMFYQPIIDTAKGKVVGMEALLRWSKPEQGFISPDKFIPLAEETGLIISIGEWVLKTVCIQNKRWIDRGYNAKRVFVNISARQFQQKDFFEKIIIILNETGLDPNYLGLEITETTVVQDIKYTMEILEKLKDIGVSISVDDFGTGYSSFNYLKDMKVDGLKIDKSFISETNDNCRKRAIAKTIILLAHQLDLTVTAEGVETKEHLEFLKENDCDYVQGYYYSKPISADEFEKFLD